MFFRSAFLTILVAMAISVSPAAADIIGDAAVSYSASQTVTVNGRTYHGKVFHNPGRHRVDVDINGIPASFILDLADRDGIVILPALVSYLDFPLPPLLSEFDRRRLDHKAVGEERIAGMRATKYRLNYAATDGTRGDGFIWLSPDNILLRIDGRILRHGHKPMVVSMILSKIDLAPQGEKLFKISKGLHKIPAEALQLMLNMGHKKSR